MMTDSEMAFAAEHAELMQQLAEDGSIFSEWPSEVHEQGTEKCEKVNNLPNEPKFHAGGGSLSSEQNGTCARDPLEDVGKSNGRTKSSFDKLTLLHTSDGKDIEMSEQDLRKARQLHQKDIVYNGTIIEEKQSSACNKSVQSMKVSGDISINEVKTCSEEVHMEAVLNATVINQLFNDNLETFEIENKIQMPVNKPENDKLNINHIVLTTPDDRMQNEQPEIAECDMSHEHMVETVIFSKSGIRLNAVKENMTTKMNTDFPTEHLEATRLSRAIRRKPLTPGTASMYILELPSEAEDEQKKSENIQTVDFADDIGSDNKLIKLNTAVSKHGFLEKMGEIDNFEIKSLMSPNDNSVQEPVTSTRHLFEAGDATSMEHLKLCRNAENPRDSLHDVQSILNSDNALLVDSITAISGRNMDAPAKAIRNEKQVSSEADANIDSTMRNVRSFESETEYSVLEGTKKKCSPVLQRFGTASGKQISLSSEALSKAKPLFSDRESERCELGTDPLEMERVNEKVSSFEKCRTTNVIQISEAFSISSLVISEADITTEHQTGIRELKERGRQDSPVLQGIKTSGGNKVCVSVKALSRAKLLFSEKGICTKSGQDETKSFELKEPEKPGSSVIHRFSTAVEKKVIVPNKDLNKSQLLFLEEEIAAENKIRASELKGTNKEGSPVLQGFSAARGKRVSLSAKAFDRAKWFFSEVEPYTDVVEDETRVSELKEKEEQQYPPVLQGFLTASGNRVSVSAKALDRVKLLFSEEESYTDMVEDETRVPELKEKEEQQHPPVLQGFSTASGNRVSVSAKALNRAKLLFSEEEPCTDVVKDETRVPELKEEEKQHQSVLQGFSTASGKSVSVSAKALNRVKLLFSEEEPCTDVVKDETIVSDLKGKEEQHPPVLQGLSGGSGKSGSVSAKTLNGAKRLFSEVEPYTDVKDETGVPEITEKEERHSLGLLESSGSSGKRVPILALNRANFVLPEEIPPEEKIGIMELKDRQDHCLSVLQGFLTVSGNRVCTSATALNRAKILFSEVEATCAKREGNEGDGSDLIEKIEKVLPILQGLSSLGGKHDSILAEDLNRHKQFISEEESDMHIITSKTNYLEFEKSPSVSETSSSLKAVSVSKDKTRKTKLKLSRKVPDQEGSNVSFKVPQSEQIHSFRPFFLNADQREIQNSKQNTFISEETCAKAGTLSGFTNTPDVERNLHNNLCIQVHGCSTDITNTKVVKDNGVATPPSGCVTEECSKRDKESMSLTQEVKESAAALLADEAVFDSPAWIMNYMSCPDILYDRDTGPTALVCSEVKDCTTVMTVEPGSPVLGSHDRCRKRRRVRMAADDDLGHSSHTPANSSFKVNHLHVMIHSCVFFCSKKYIWSSYQVLCQVVSTPALYSGGPKFKLWPRISFFMLFLSASRMVP
jgi:hypothetical protein